jgi:hypothetical protein
VKRRRLALDSSSGRERLIASLEESEAAAATAAAAAAADDTPWFHPKGRLLAAHKRPAAQPPAEAAAQPPAVAEARDGITSLPSSFPCPLPPLSRPC